MFHRSAVCCYLVLFFLCLMGIQDAAARSWQKRHPHPRVFLPTCQNTRIDTRVSVLHDEAMALSSGLQGAYTGRGVLVGIIDIGIEYNHLNFRDPQTGISRLKGAVLYRPEEGDPDSVREYYDDPMQLDTLTTDTPYNAHGTHTAGIAAGSYPGLGLQGMAPEADLMLCGTSSLTDNRIIDALRLIFARADELDVPCVVNLSIGNPVDWKDGLTPFCLACDSLTDGGNAPGRVIVVSAGNDGAKPFAFHHEFTDSEPVYALLKPGFFQARRAYLNPNVDVYCADDKPVALDFVLYDTLSHQLKESPFEQHLLDTLEQSHLNRRHLCLDADTCWMTNLPHHLLAARFTGEEGAAITGYYINDMSVEYPVLKGPDEHWLRGTSEHSISDLCCTDAVISVGSYSAVDAVENIFGRQIAALAPKGEVCSFSSYGTTWQGVPKPDVLCPGASVVSSFSSYWEDKIEYYYSSGRNLNSPMMHVVTPTEDDVPWFRPDEPGRSYYWIHSVGTSQSSPAMAGIIALWLEACPTLSVNDVRQIVQQTSLFDDQCLHAPSAVMQAGNGKADALAGMLEVQKYAQAIDVVGNAQVGSMTDIYDLQGRRISVAYSGSRPFIRKGKIVMQPQ